MSSSTIFNYALGEQSEMHYTEISANYFKKTQLTYMYQSTIKKIRLPKLFKQIFQDSIRRLIQTISINQYVESQTGN